MGYIVTMLVAVVVATIMIAPYLILRIRLNGETFPVAVMNAYLPWFALVFGTFALFPTGSGSTPLDCAAITATAAMAAF